MPSDKPNGPGRLVLIVGPSGAGKDTLIAAARDRCRNDPQFVFPRRIITRLPSSHEDHQRMSAAEFDRALTAGRFSLWWQAHGLSYALPRSVDADIACGRTVICNVSRTVTEAARSRYARASVILVTAPIEVLAERLARRGRESAHSIADRLRRTAFLDADCRPDVVIENLGTVEHAVGLLVDAIYGRMTIANRSVRVDGD